MVLMGFLVMFLGAGNAHALDQAWGRISDPLILSVSQRNFAALPLEGKVADPERYWSSDFWSRKKGGINLRWNATRVIGHNLRSPSKAQAARMTLDELATLAPTEKLDLFSGNYDYPLKRWVASYAKPSAPSWEGICNGWSEASLHHPEPKPVVVTNPDGIQIPFGSSDIKALLSWYYHRRDTTDFRMMGARCGRNPFGGDRCRNDLNAGSFHLVLTNKMGLEGGSFIADMDRGHEVWNHVIYEYSSTILNPSLRPLRGSARGTVRVARVKTVVGYVFVATKSWEPVLGTELQKINKRTYEYYLDLDAAGNVIGGDWISAQRPDFLWTSSPATEFTGVMAKLAEIVPPAVE